MALWTVACPTRSWHQQCRGALGWLHHCNWAPHPGNAWPWVHLTIPGDPASATGVWELSPLEHGQPRGSPVSLGGCRGGWGQSLGTGPAQLPSASSHPGQTHKSEAVASPCAGLRQSRIRPSPVWLQPPQSQEGAHCAPPIQNTPIPEPLLACTCAYMHAHT